MQDKGRLQSVGLKTNYLYWYERKNNIYTNKKILNALIQKIKIE